MATPATFNDEQRDAFLAPLRETGNISAAARSARITRASAYQRRKEDGEFSDAWDDAIEEAVDALEEEARYRALIGRERKVYYKGAEVDTIRMYSDQLLILLLKAHRPEKYAGISPKMRKPEQNALIINITGRGDERPQTDPAS